MDILNASSGDFLGEEGSVCHLLLKLRVFQMLPCVGVSSRNRHDPASIRGVPCDLGVHAVHSSDLQHHSVSVPGPGVRDTQPHPRGVAPHPHHGHVQHVGLCRQGDVSELTALRSNHYMQINVEAIFHSK